MASRAVVIALCASSWVVAACNTAESEWSRAKLADTLLAYQAFIAQYPDDPHTQNARGRVFALLDDQNWKAAQRANTVAAFQSYLQNEPGGTHVGGAKYAITAFQRADDWKLLGNDASAASLIAFLKKYPQGVESNEARQRLVDVDYRVQLAGGLSKSAAERERGQLQARFGTVLHEIVVVAPAAPGLLYSVTSEPMSEAQAKSACDALEHRHQSCKLISNPPLPG